MPGHDATHHELEQIRAQRRHSQGDFAVGPIEAVSTGETGDAYVRIKRKEEKPEPENEDEGDKN